MNQSGENDPLSANEQVGATHSPQRRNFLIALAGGFGLFAAGGNALGQSLLVRPMAPSAALFVGPTTLTFESTRSFTIAATIPATIVLTRSSTATKKPGTYTSTEPPYGGGSGSMTSVYPAPGFQTQPITVAWTESYVYTPPATNYHTESWKGSVYTLTSSRTPTFMTMTGAMTFTASYTTLVVDGGGGIEPVVAREIPAQRVTRDADVKVDTVDAEGLDLRNPASRRSFASVINLGHGIGS